MRLSISGTAGIAVREQEFQDLVAFGRTLGNPRFEAKAKFVLAALAEDNEHFDEASAV